MRAIDHFDRCRPHTRAHRPCGIHPGLTPGALCCRSHTRSEIYASVRIRELSVGLKKKKLERGRRVLTLTSLQSLNKTIEVITHMLKNAVVVSLLVAFMFSLAPAQALDQAKVVAGAERVWEKTVKAYVAPGPGCAVGISLNGQTVFEKAFGLAEMEHNIPNTPQTIFESGSVAKQFTAAAVVLLAQEGKLSLDDPVKKYITELPEYDKPITLRHILTHTAGLRDWGSVMSLTGAGRGDRVVTQDIALDVISRQKGLDFTPGAEYSYSNSGYQLAAILVERVSRKKFGEFT